MFQRKFVKIIKTRFVFDKFYFSKIVPCMRQCGKLWYSRTDHRRQHKTARKRCDFFTEWI